MTVDSIFFAGLSRLNLSRGCNSVRHVTISETPHVKPASHSPAARRLGSRWSSERLRGGGGVPRAAGQRLLQYAHRGQGGSQHADQV